MPQLQDIIGMFLIVFAVAGIMGIGDPARAIGGRRIGVVIDPTRFLIGFQWKNTLQRLCAILHIGPIAIILTISNHPLPPLPEPPKPREEKT